MYEVKVEFIHKKNSANKIKITVQSEDTYRGKQLAIEQVADRNINPDDYLIDSIVGSYVSTTCTGQIDWGLDSPCPDSFPF